MTTQWIRGLIQRLFSEEATRRAFLEAPERVLAEETITLEERRAVLRLHSRLATAGPAHASFGPGTSWP